MNFWKKVIWLLIGAAGGSSLLFFAQNKFQISNHSGGAIQVQGDNNSLVQSGGTSDRYVDCYKSTNEWQIFDEVMHIQKTYSFSYEFIRGNAENGISKIKLKKPNEEKYFRENICSKKSDIINLLSSFRLVDKKCAASVGGRGIAAPMHEGWGDPSKELVSLIEHVCK